MSETGNPMSESPRPGDDAGEPASERDAGAELRAYIAANRDRFTPEALTRAATDAGWREWEVRAAIDEATLSGPQPERIVRARRVVLLAYAATYVLLVLGMVTSSRPTVISETPIAIVILTIALGLAFGISYLFFLRRRTTSVATLVVIPLILLAVVGGTCLATGLPTGFLAGPG